MDELKQFQTGNARLTGFVRAGLCYFGHWHQTPDREAENENFRLFESWAQEHGFEQVYGPIDGSTLGNYRLRLNAFAEKAFWGEPGNDRSPVQFLQERGYSAKEKYYSYVCRNLVRVGALLDSLGRQIPSGAVQDLRFEELELARWENLEPEMRALANEAFAANFGFVPMTRESFQAVYSPAVRDRLCPQTSILVRSSEGRLVGFCANFRDSENPKRVLVKTLCVAQAYRRMGMTFFEMMRRVLLMNRNYDSAILCLMKEGNVPSLFLKDFADEIREYGLFCKKI